MHLKSEPESESETESESKYNSSLYQSESASESPFKERTDKAQQDGKSHLFRSGIENPTLNQNRIMRS
ncbi:hypothetical protein SDJN03_18652, partial [Cucurbita argyrosperma subsp. sororia]